LIPSGGKITFQAISAFSEV